MLRMFSDAILSLKVFCRSIETGMQYTCLTENIQILPNTLNIMTYLWEHLAFSLSNFVSAKEYGETVLKTNLTPIEGENEGVLFNTEVDAKEDVDIIKLTLMNIISSEDGYEVLENNTEEHSEIITEEPPETITKEINVSSNEVVVDKVTNEDETCISEENIISYNDSPEEDVNDIPSNSSEINISEKSNIDSIVSTIITERDSCVSIESDFVVEKDSDDDLRYPDYFNDIVNETEELENNNVNEVISEVNIVARDQDDGYLTEALEDFNNEIVQSVDREEDNLNSNIITDVESDNIESYNVNSEDTYSDSYNVETLTTILENEETSEPSNFENTNVEEYLELNSTDNNSKFINLTKDESSENSQESLIKLAEDSLDVENNSSSKVKDKEKKEVKKKIKEVEATPEKKKGFFSRLFGGKSKKANDGEVVEYEKTIAKMSEDYVDSGNMHGNEVAEFEFHSSSNSVKGENSVYHVTTDEQTKLDNNLEQFAKHLTNEQNKSNSNGVKEVSSNSEVEKNYDVTILKGIKNDNADAITYKDVDIVERVVERKDKPVSKLEGKGKLSNIRKPKLIMYNSEYAYFHSLYPDRDRLDEFNDIYKESKNNGGNIKLEDLYLDNGVINKEEYLLFNRDFLKRSILTHDELLTRDVILGEYTLDKCKELKILEISSLNDSRTICVSIDTPNCISTAQQLIRQYNSVNIVYTMSEYIIERLDIND
jgi:hypothetical protein